MSGQILLLEKVDLQVCFESLDRVCFSDRLRESVPYFGIEFVVVLHSMGRRAAGVVFRSGEEEEALLCVSCWVLVNG